MGKKYKIEELGRLSPKEYGQAPKLPIVAILDQVRSLYNVGSFFRTADALGISGLALCGVTGQPPSAEIHKSALGAEEVVRWQYFRETMEALHYFRAKGYRICSVEQARGSVELGSIASCPLLNDVNGLALVFGNEVFGVQQEVIDASDCCIELAQYGTKHSMNVSVTGGIVLWEMARIWRTARTK